MEIQSAAVSKSHIRKDFLIYKEMCQYFTIYEEAVSHIYMTLQLLHSEFPYLWAKFDFLLISATGSKITRTVGSGSGSGEQINVLKSVHNSTKRARKARPTLCAFSFCVKILYRFIGSPCCLYFFQILLFFFKTNMVYFFCRSWYFSGYHSCVKSNFLSKNLILTCFFSITFLGCVERNKDTAYVSESVGFFKSSFYCLYKKWFRKKAVTVTELAATSKQLILTEARIRDSTSCCWTDTYRSSRLLKNSLVPGQHRLSCRR